jgi:hypothetical protein
MKLGQVQNISEGQTLEVNHHGPRAAWGLPLAGRTTRWWSPSQGLHP